jgi:hypothetical protein
MAGPIAMDLARMHVPAATGRGRAAIVRKRAQVVIVPAPEIDHGRRIAARSMAADSMESIVVRWSVPLPIAAMQASAIAAAAVRISGAAVVAARMWVVVEADANSVVAAEEAAASAAVVDVGAVVAVAADQNHLTT